MDQAVEMMGKLAEYWEANPIQGAKRVAELLMNQDKIKAMITIKAIREKVNPDKAIPVLEKILESIPTSLKN